MTCTHNDELIALGALRLLSAEEQTRLDAQVSACPACRERWQDYQALAAAMPQLVQPETAPAPALNGKRAASPDGGARVGIDIEPPVVPRPQQRPAHQRAVKVLSGLAAAVLLLGLVGGFWLLLLSRPPRQAVARQTIYNACGNQAANSVPGQPACGLIVMDYSQTPAVLEEVDPITGKMLAGLKPLPVGNAQLASVSTDHHILALGILPTGAQDPAYIQIVHLDTWTLGAKLPLQTAEWATVLELAIAPDGSGVYLIFEPAGLITDPNRITSLEYFAYDRAKDTLKFVWFAPLPFYPDDGSGNNTAFALSADGDTAYIFSGALTTPQVTALPLKANGIGTPVVRDLPSIAPFEAPPTENGNYTYQPGDPIASWYQPAVIFAPDQGKLYVVHAETQDPSKDALLVVELSNMIVGPDTPISNEGNLAAAVRAPGSAAANTMQPYLSVQPLKEPFVGRSETGTLSPDGNWIYLSGTINSPQFNSDGSWKGEQSSSLGLLKIGAQSGNVVGHWLSGADYSTLTFGPDGRNLYMFGPPPDANPTSPTVESNLLIFDTRQDQIVGSFPAIQGGWFFLPLF